MKPFPFSTIVLAIPVVCLGFPSCASMDRTQARLAEWKEKREERQMAKDLAEAEKQLAEEAAAGVPGAAGGLEESIFLSYSEPVEGASLVEAPALPGSELPVMDWGSGDEGVVVGGEGPIFLGDTATPPVVDTDLVRAWASSISPIMGASLTEPLITAAMTAQVNSTETAVAAHAAATDSAPLASAFAGEVVQTNVPVALTSELEHH